VDIALFDGEDLGRESHLEEYLQGSREYARNLKIPLPRAAILLDMVGDQDLSIPQEVYSLRNSASLIKEIFDLAAKLNQPAFDPHSGDPVYDDHIPLLEAGIQAADLIDFNYPYWHTLQDTPENCSLQSLGSVGKVVLAWVYQQQ
jgi:Zn-dependent M28 family amino/carboxypeptidase